MGADTSYRMAGKDSDKAACEQRPREVEEAVWAYRCVWWGGGVRWSKGVRGAGP